MKRSFSFAAAGFAGGIVLASAAFVFLVPTKADLNDPENKPLPIKQNRDAKVLHDLRLEQVFLTLNERGEWLNVLDAAHMPTADIDAMEAFILREVQGELGGDSGNEVGIVLRGHPNLPYQQTAKIVEMCRKHKLKVEFRVMSPGAK